MDETEWRKKENALWEKAEGSVLECQRLLERGMDDLLAISEGRLTKAEVQQKQDSFVRACFLVGWIFAVAATCKLCGVI